MGRGDFGVTGTAPKARIDLLLRRVHGEFLEMPGLRLTCAQAQRLWGLDEGTCLQLLGSLVEEKFLCRRRDGMYTRLSDGWSAGPQVGMARTTSSKEVPSEKEAAMNIVGWDPLYDLEELPSRLNDADSVDLDTEKSSDLDLAARSLVNVMVTARDAAHRAAWARAIHTRSARCERRFVTICGCPQAAMTRAVSAGEVEDWFVRAAGGTLFIDHIGQLPPNAQAVLVLRLTEQASQAGGRTTSRRDRGVRIIAGSDRSLHADLSAGAFSEELFYRLNVIHIDQPLG